MKHELRELAEVLQNTAVDSLLGKPSQEQVSHLCLNLIATWGAIAGGVDEHRSFGTPLERILVDNMRGVFFYMAGICSLLPMDLGLVVERTVSLEEKETVDSLVIETAVSMARIFYLMSFLSPASLGYSDVEPVIILLLKFCRRAGLDLHDVLYAGEEEE